MIRIIPGFIAMMLLLVVLKSGAQSLKEIDSLRAKLSGIKNDSVKLETLNRLSSVLLYNYITDGMDTVLGQALKLAVKTNNQQARAETLKNMAVMAIYRDEYDSSMRYSREALAIFQSANNEKGILQCLNNIGTAYLKTGEADSSISYYNKAIIAAKKFKSEDKISLLAKTLAGLGGAYNFQGNYIKAQENYIKAINYAERGYDSMALASITNNIAVLYKLTGDFKNALIYFNRTLQIYQDINHTKGSISTYNNLASLYLSKGKTDSSFYFLSKSEAIALREGSKYDIATVYSLKANAYQNSGMYTLGVQYYKKAAELAKQTNNLRLLSGSLANIGLGYLFISDTSHSIDDYRMAIKYLEQAYVIAKKTGNKDYERNDLENLAEAYSLVKDYKKAYEYRIALSDLNDSIFNAEKSKELQKLQVSFETERKEKQIIILNKDKEIHSKELAWQKLVRNGFIIGFAVVFIFAGVFFKQRNKIRKEKIRSENLLLNILPSEVAEELKVKGSADAKQFDEVTVMFTDFKNFTQISESLSPSALVAEIHTCFKAFDDIITKHNIEKIKTIGDSYMCAGGLPVTNKTNANDVVKAALEIADFMKSRNGSLTDGVGINSFEIRVGIHTGPVVAGIVGVKKFAYDIWGDTVNIASRMESSGEAGKINISGSTYNLVKDKFECKHRGKISAKNKGEIDMYFVLRSIADA
ncbi:MAG: tetratricopeptide repeat protein [Bacteroidota bacterium]|nr:tetratricopeptide repeat protein [Bacteroidota bacterium]